MQGHTSIQKTQQQPGTSMPVKVGYVKNLFETRGCPPKARPVQVILTPSVSIVPVSKASGAAAGSSSSTSLSSHMLSSIPMKPFDDGLESDRISMTIWMMRKRTPKRSTYRLWREGNDHEDEFWVHLWRMPGEDTAPGLLL